MAATNFWRVSDFLERLKTPEKPTTQQQPPTMRPSPKPPLKTASVTHTTQVHVSETPKQPSPKPSPLPQARNQIAQRPNSVMQAPMTAAPPTQQPLMAPMKPGPPPMFAQQQQHHEEEPPLQPKLSRSQMYQPAPAAVNKDPYISSSFVAPKPAATAAAAANCDISPYVANSAGRQQRPQPPMDVLAPAAAPPPQPPPPAPQPTTPSSMFNKRPQKSDMVEPDGGYNFRRIMDDHFEHYKRPPSREPSVDKMPATLAEASKTSSGLRPSRASSRTRTPLRQMSTSKTDVNIVDKAEIHVHDSKTNGGPPSLFNGNQASTGLKFRGPSQTVENIGAIPKRTESMYFKPFQEVDPKVS